MLRPSVVQTASSAGNSCWHLYYTNVVEITCSIEKRYSTGRPAIPGQRITSAWTMCSWHLPSQCSLAESALPARWHASTGVSWRRPMDQSVGSAVLWTRVLSNAQNPFPNSIRRPWGVPNQYWAFFGPIRFPSWSRHHPESRNRRPLENWLVLFAGEEACRTKIVALTRCLIFGSPSLEFRTCGDVQWIQESGAMSQYSSLPCARPPLWIIPNAPHDTRETHRNVY